jgi:hypothetical protein
MRSVAIVLALLGSIGAVLLVSAPTASATTYVRGIISSPTTWGGGSETNYTATGHVTIRPSGSLTIVAGTRVNFDPGIHLFVEGRLTADGTSAKPITFTANNTGSPFPWGGVQFNASSAGSVSWSTFDRVDRAITATDSSPDITSNTILQAGVGFAFVRSSSVVSSNTIVRATNIGVYANASGVQIVGNSINGTGLAVQVEQPGTPTISRNTITNVSSTFAIGILLTGGATASIDGNSIQGVRGSSGANGVAPGAPGRDGAIGAGIYVYGAPSAWISANTVDTVTGGRGGDGQANPSATGGRGGNGGAAAGIVVAVTPDVTIQWNMVTSLTSGSGGSGGGALTTTTGGRGGDAGTAVGIEMVASTTAGQVYTNTVNGIAGGNGGVGGIGGTTNGNGGVGGDADGVFLIGVANSDASGNSLQSVRGGIGGNGAGAGAGAGSGATGGAANGIAVFSVSGAAIVHGNTFQTVTAGNGGRGVRGGYGGNATGVLSFGNNDGSFNATQVSFNQVGTVTGGAGGIGTRFGGNGGAAVGVGEVYVSPTLSSNWISTMQGGRGGDGVIGGGRGGDAFGMIAGLVANGLSADDTISGVAKGGAGIGPAPPSSSADGYFLVGNKTFTTRFTTDNATLTSVGSYEFYVDNYTKAVAVNSPFTKLAVMAAGNLTVRNYLEVDALWPNGFTPVAGTRILVMDGGSRIWDRLTPSGVQPWILVTDRIYVNSPVPTDNQTQVSVTYAPYSFANNPRSVDMGTSHTESFVMVDKDVPTSAAGALPAYENVLTFSVWYTASDGNGTGLGNITLWYRTGGSGGWVQYAVQPAGNFGQFTFTASSDGVYEFVTTADDLAGNQEARPSANDTWTIVDTLRPGSRVDPLPTYRTVLTFLVSWAPDSGVTDIATYEVQYNRGAAWVTWLAGTSQTSSVFTAPQDGLYQFRSKATDEAGNIEIVPATNDTWTIVDTNPPYTSTQPLPVWQTSSSFVVQWSRESDDVATYRIQVRDNVGAWADWVTVPVSTTSGTYAGAQDGHTYEFRSIGTDLAGNVQTAPLTNQSWTIVDLSPPDSAVTALPQYQTSALFPITWGPVSGTTDIVSYTVEVSDNGGTWAQVPGAVGTTSTSTSAFGADGHQYAFRSFAVDRAGNVEPAPAANDTWTIVDVRNPYVTNSAPVGADTNTTPWIAITFSEPMDRNSVEQALSLTPAINGNFQWSADSRTVTFVPARELQTGQTYFVVVDIGARDLAGNPMLQSKTFQFSTAPSFFTAFWWAFLLVGAAVAGALFMILRRRQAEASKPAPPPTTAKQSDAIVEDVFLLNHKDGLLIKHETRRLRPDVDTDILSGMLTAVQAFVKDALRGDDYAELNEMTVGQMHILIGRGKWLVLAARIEGDGTQSWTSQIERCIKDMEDHHWDQIEDWDGDMGLARVLTPYIKKLIQGGYT